MHRRELHVSGVRVAAVPELVQLNLGLLEQLELVSELACLEQPVRLERERQEPVREPAVRLEPTAEPEPQMAARQEPEPELERPIRQLPQAAER